MQASLHGLSHAATAAVVIVLVLGAAVFGVYYLRTSSGGGITITTSTTTSETSSSALPPTPCSQPYPGYLNNRTVLANGTAITRVGFPALLMSPGATAALCVSYSSSPQILKQFGGAWSGTVQSSASTWGPDDQLSPTTSVTVEPAPPSVTVAAQRSAVVEYEVKAAQNSTGFYGLSLLQNCVPFPVAVGYTPSVVNSSDFQGLFGSYDCPTEVLIGQVVGYTGADLAYVTSESKVNLKLNITGSSVTSFPTPGGGENATFSVNLHTFSQRLTLGLSLSDSLVKTFRDDPDFTASANDLCTWYPSNTAAVNGMTTRTFEQEPGSSLRVSAPTLQLAPYSNTTYRFSVLLSPPIAANTAIDVGLNVEGSGTSESFSVGAYFPLSVAGHLQIVSGACEASSSG